MADTRARIAALIITAGLVLTACSGEDGDKQTPAAGDPPAATGVISGPPDQVGVDCADTSLSMGDWTRYCGPGTGNTIQQTAPSADTAPKPLGQPAETTGSDGAGTLEFTPTTVVYSAPGEAYNTPSRGFFVTVTVKQHNTGAVPATAASGFSGGWAYIAPDGEALDSVSVASDFKSPIGPVAPGTFEWSGETWDIRGNQRGGIVQYTDGTGVVHRWQIPAQDSGPQIDEVRKGLG